MPLKVRVRDFQSIEDAEIVIDGLTVLTGTNNAGKSAFFRAIRGALTNARGSDFVRHGSKHCIVDLEDLETGQTLRWSKGGDGTNDYTINGKHYPNVGHGVPPEARVLGIEPISVGNAELWPQIAPQITGVSFLLDQPGSVVAEAVADVDRVNQLSRALKECESERRSVRGEAKTRRKDGKTLAERREGFAGLDAVLEDIERLEKARAQGEKIARATGNMGKLRDRYRRAQEAVSLLEDLDVAHDHLPSWERVQEGRQAAQERAQAQGLRDHYIAAHGRVVALEGLDDVARALPSEERVMYAQQFRKAIGVTVDLAMRFEEARDELGRAEDGERVLSSISLDEAPVTMISRVRKAKVSAKSLRDRYGAARDAVRALDQQIETVTTELESLQERSSTILDSFEECPTCGGSLDHVR